ncbi:hypothetical protein HRV97_14295 [Sphingomonas sp. HHU CXW]|uniref:Uncharacterized protein n=1 Tax=Sphingomonas hominis TaxID=2741495 RepID=A0ABX2JR55_9SPHN|nr:hypothetical protein [Sphingomonas hominis]NTS66328.1 hypothetical protein [Sphingomonas hominis]
MNSAIPSHAKVTPSCTEASLLPWMNTGIDVVSPASFYSLSNRYSSPSTQPNPISETKSRPGTIYVRRGASGVGTNSTCVPTGSATTVGEAIPRELVRAALYAMLKKTVRWA